MNKYLLAAAVVAAGCATTPSSMTLNKQNVDGSQLANIVTQRAEAPMLGMVQDQYSTLIDAVYDEAGKELFDTGFRKRALGEINLPAGRYKLRAICSNAFGHANPELDVELRPSKKYRLRCSIFTGKNILGMKVDSHAEITLDDLEELAKKPVKWP